VYGVFGIATKTIWNNFYKNKGIIFGIILLKNTKQYDTIISIIMWR